MCSASEPEIAETDENSNSKGEEKEKGSEWSSTKLGRAVRT